MSGCCGNQKSCGKPSDDHIHSSVKDFYAAAQEKGVQEMGSNLCSVNCPLATRITPTVEKTLAMIHDDVKNSYFGCGLPFPFEVESMNILDLGSGTGRDVFLLGGLAGSKGHVTGVDMTPAMLERSNSMIEYHREKFGFDNFTFVQGKLEDLDEVKELKMATFDIIVSNCVINLCADKAAVFKHAYNLLKPGGELCFSDVYTEKPLPENVKSNELVWNECFGGALPWDEFVSICKSLGFLGPFTVSSEDYKPTSEILCQLIGDLKFWSRTVRLYKPSECCKTSASCCGIQKKVTYLGTVIDAEKELYFSKQFVFKTNEPTSVPHDVLCCLTSSRFNKHFKLD